VVTTPELSWLLFTLRAAPTGISGTFTTHFAIILFYPFLKQFFFSIAPGNYADILSWVSLWYNDIKLIDHNSVPL